MGALWVALGAALGGLGRYGVSLLFRNPEGHLLPWWTLAVNLAGSFFIGIAMSVALQQRIGDDMRLFLVTGILGGFTTFSAFSFENLDLWQRGRFDLLFAYALGSVALGLACAFLGFWVAGRLA